VPAGGSKGPLVDIGRRFREHGLTGTFVLLAVHDDTLLVHDPARAEEPLLPASTFKIPNSLIALETGVVPDENEVFKYDGAKTGPQSTWKDQSLRTGIAGSAVWLYQELARRIGAKRMQEWVDRIGYGNRDLGGGIDQFWLNGALRITARQQIEFLRRLYANELPFSERTLRIVKDILVLEKTDTYVLRGKTGWAGVDGSVGGIPGVGWLVGWVERGAQAWMFALNVHMTASEQAPLRRPLATAILADLGLMEKK
jgi:beta-lactamase class D